MSVALLITTYNRPDALDVLLDSVAKQSQMPDEVIICDDGSRHDTSAIIASWACRLPIFHAWTRDLNFRAAFSRNLGILKSRSEVLVFVDGDCLLPPSFIENYLKLARPGYLISGGRHLLTRRKTESILSHELPFSSAFHHWKFLTLPFGSFRDRGSKDWQAVRTCNLGVYRDDALKIAGFDEGYIGWGREDSDFVVRLIHAGIEIRSGRLATCVAHLYHRESSRAQLSVNDQRLQTVLNNPNSVMPSSSILK